MGGAESGEGGVEGRERVGFEGVGVDELRGGSVSCFERCGRSWQAGKLAARLASGRSGGEGRDGGALT